MEILMYYLLIAIIAILSLISYKLRSKTETQLGYVISVCVVTAIIGLSSVFTMSSDRIEPIDIRLIDHVAHSIRAYPEWREDTTSYPKSYTLTYGDNLEKDISEETYNYFKELWNPIEKSTRKVDSMNLVSRYFTETKWNRYNEDALIYTKTGLYVNYLLNLYEYSEVTPSEAQSLKLFSRDRNLITNESGIVEPRYRLVYGLEYPDTLLRRLNVISAITNNIRPILLIWQGETKKIPIKKQKDYWRGGKENEVVFCIGVNNSKDREILWSDSFSWDEKSDFDKYVLEKALLPGNVLDLNKVINSVIEAYKSNLWNPKLSEDYSIVKLPISKFHMSFTLMVLMIITLIVISDIYSKLSKLKKEGKNDANLS